MSDRKFDAAEIRRIGEEVCPKLADEYENVVDTADEAGRYSRAFEGSSGAMSDFGELWDQCFRLFYNAAYETGVNVRGYGSALVDIADQGEADEHAIDQSFHQAVDDNMAEGYSTVSEQTAEQDINPETDDIYNLDQAPNPYEEDLSPDPNAGPSTFN
ncbi:hypothetical protein [Glycomyces sp. YM15]|uniref:hypothetical protein n=1 Tax=Glycomyces sp. YM15 TaxID=2800446 RepID=UPI00196238E8|nr:hypothetical protein [Glycomyces sp. YM15]